MNSQDNAGVTALKERAFSQNEASGSLIKSLISPNITRQGWKKPPQTPGDMKDRAQTANLTNLQAQASTQASFNKLQRSDHKWTIEDDVVFRRTGLSVGIVAGTTTDVAFGFEPYTIPVEDFRYRI